MNKIKVDFLCLFQEGTGQTVYFKGLSEELKNLVDLKIILPNKSRVFNLLNHFSNSLALKFLPFLIKKEIRKNSIVHIINQELFFLLPLIKNPLVLTLHDLSIYSYYKTWKEKDVKLLDKAEKIACDSVSTKNDLSKHFPLMQKKCKVIYCGLPKGLTKSTQNIKKKYFLNDSDMLLLFVGSDDKKKNFFSLLKVFSRLKEKNLVLIKIGSPWSIEGNNSQRKKFQEFIAKNNLEKKVRFLDFIPRQDLTDFYFSAEVFVNPSHFEGFGFTLIEAMACGCPVICSDNTSFPEVAGNASLFFDSENEEELREKLELILNDKKLKEKLISNGRENIKRFNWKKSAEQLLELYKQIIKKKEGKGN